MANSKEELKLIRMNEVEATAINWLWYPYVPYGKITVIQGDPSDGKTTALLAIAAAVTTGAALPESKTSAEPMSVIFQTAEDGLGDTVKPRLVQSGADCTRVIVIGCTCQRLLPASRPFLRTHEGRRVYRIKRVERGSTAEHLTVLEYKTQQERNGPPQ